MAPECASAGDCAFAAGYLEAGGPRPFLRHFLDDVLPCEGSTGWGPFYGGANFYWTRAQFSGDTWPKVAAYLEGRGLAADPDDPYITGAGVGWWVQLAAPASQWPTCWRRGVVP